VVGEGIRERKMGADGGERREYVWNGKEQEGGGELGRGREWGRL